MFTFDLLTVVCTYQDLLSSPSPSASGVRVALPVQQLNKHLVKNEIPSVPFFQFPFLASLFLPSLMENQLPMKEHDPLLESLSHHDPGRDYASQPHCQVCEAMYLAQTHGMRMDFMYPLQD